MPASAQPQTPAPAGHPQHAMDQAAPARIPAKEQQGAGNARDRGILPCRRAWGPWHGARGISWLSAGSDRGTVVQGKLQEPQSQDGAWELGAGSHWAVTDGPTLQETAPAMRLPPA